MTREESICSGNLLTCTSRSEIIRPLHNLLAGIKLPDNNFESERNLFTYLHNSASQNYNSIWRFTLDCKHINAVKCNNMELKNQNYPWSKKIEKLSSMYYTKPFS